MSTQLRDSEVRNERMGERMINTLDPSIEWEDSEYQEGVNYFLSHSHGRSFLTTLLTWTIYSIPQKNGLTVRVSFTNNDHNNNYYYFIWR